MATIVGLKAMRILQMEADLQASIAAHATRIAALEAAGVGDVGVSGQSGSYTLVLADAHKAVEINSAGAATLVVPTNATVAFPIGTVIEIVQLGAGMVSILADAGVTIRSRDGLLDLAGQYAVASLRKRAANEWVLAGDLA